MTPNPLFEEMLEQINPRAAVMTPGSMGSVEAAVQRALGSNTFRLVNTVEVGGVELWLFGRYVSRELRHALVANAPLGVAITLVTFVDPVFQAQLMRMLKDAERLGAERGDAVRDIALELARQYGRPLSRFITEEPFRVG